MMSTGLLIRKARGRGALLHGFLSLLIVACRYLTLLMVTLRYLLIGMAAMMSKETCRHHLALGRS